jgi:hypothetical protein
VKEHEEYEALVRHSPSPPEGAQRPAPSEATKWLAPPERSGTSYRNSGLYSSTFSGVTTSVPVSIVIGRMPYSIAWCMIMTG